MKKMSKKGFTLIELLAIIVILAIIAVITVPIILNIIDNAKKGAARSSVLGYADAVKLARVTYMYENDGAVPSSIASLGTISYEGDTVSNCVVAINSDGTFSMTGCQVLSYSDSVTFEYNTANTGAGKVKETVTP